MVSNDDDEWEYEYDEIDTEDFYVSIDLSNVPDAQVLPSTERRPGHPTLLKSRLRALHATRGLPPETSNETSNPQEMNSVGEVQITGLHTPNPLLMYNGQLLSCHWTATVGTDLYFTRPSAGDTNSEKPLCSLPSVDLMALGTAKLIAKVGRLRPRDDLFNDANVADLARAEGSIAGSGADTFMSPASAASDEQQVPPANRTDFLARLNEAKRRRGETSRLVPAHTSEGIRLIAEDSSTTFLPQEDYPSQSINDITKGDT